MKIYTKTGDDGTTGLFGGTRVTKDSLRIESYGEVDELNCVIGLARSHNTISPAHDQLLTSIQEHLFILGADLASPSVAGSKKFSIPRVTSAEVTCLEQAIDKLESTLPVLKNFILPGGSPAGATLHLARTVCRRAERRVVSLFHAEPAIGEKPMEYLNRLSDFLFVLARSVNYTAGTVEHPWIPNPPSQSENTD